MQSFPYTSLELMIRSREKGIVALEHANGEYYLPELAWNIDRDNGVVEHKGLPEDQSTRFEFGF